MAPFSIRKALLPHMSTFLLIICSTLTPFAARKASLSHMSSFLLIAFPLLAQVYIENTFVTIWDLFCWLHALYWPNSLSVTPYELFSANYMPFTGPGFYQKTFLTRIWARSANDMPFIDLIPCPSGFVTRCELFYANDMPCTVPIPYKKALLPNRSSFLLNGYLYWPNSLSKKHLPSKFDLFSANYILFTSPILYQKGSVAPYELFLLIKCSSLTPFTAKKALLPHISYFF